MSNQSLIFSKLEGYSGIRLKGNNALVLKPGINLIVGKNGCGKTNLLQLVSAVATGNGDLKTRIESSFFNKCFKEIHNNDKNKIDLFFDEMTIVEYSLKGKLGNLQMTIDNVPQEYVLKNIIRSGADFQNHIKLEIKTVPVRHKLIHGNQSTPKFEMSGFPVNFNLFSREHDNRAHLMMGDAIQSVSDFIRHRWTEFYRSDEFVSRMKSLEDSINQKFERFLGKTNKRVKIDYSDIGYSGRVSVSLMDNDNYIESSSISTGESILYNLIFGLASLREDPCDIVSLDEPDTHMHDDMIQVLVDELCELHKIHPNCIMLVATHSTSLIEKLALVGKMAHIITFDGDRNVSNSERHRID